VIGELREPAEIYYFVRQTGEEGQLTVPAGARNFNITLPRPAGLVSIDFVGIKGIVPTKRTDTVEVAQQ